MPILSQRSRYSRRRRIVARADRVAAHLLQDLQLALHRPVVERHSQRAEVRVIARPVHLHVLPVEKESRVGIELDRADAERRLVAIEHRVVLRQRRHRHVAVRALRVPQLRVRHIHLHLRRLPHPARNRHRHRRGLRNRARALRVVRVELVDIRVQVHLRARRALVVDPRLQLDRGRIRRHVRRRHVRPVMRHMHGPVFTSHTCR